MPCKKLFRKAAMSLTKVVRGAQQKQERHHMVQICNKFYGKCSKTLYSLISHFIEVKLFMQIQGRSQYFEQGEGGGSKGSHDSIIFK